MPKEILTLDEFKCPNCESYRTKKTDENKYMCLDCCVEYSITA